MNRPNSALNKLKFILLATLFAAPLLLALLLYSWGWRPQGGVNYGELTQPARPIRAVVLRTLNGAAVEFPTDQKKWTMLYLGSGRCGSACRGSLHKMRQVHLAQGRDAGRIRRVFIAIRVPRAELDALLADYPDMQILTAAAAPGRSLDGQFGLTGIPAELPGRVYVLDPLGNWMMSYRPDADPSGMRKDFVRLLKISQIG